MRTLFHRSGSLARPFIGVVLAIGASACTGVLDGPSGGSSTGGGPVLGTAGSNASGGATNPNGGSPTGNPDQSSPIQAAPTWRLTNLEYRNSVQDLFGIAATTPLDPDGAVAGYRAGLVAGDATVQAYYDSAIAVAAALDVQTLAPCEAAAAAAGGADCAAKFIDSVAPKAFRHPLDADTRAGLVALFAGISAQFGYEAGIRGLSEQLLQSPYFLYHLELEEQAKGLGAVKVTGYSMASRLSYLIWGSMPDDALFAKAAADELSTPEQIEAEARRLLMEPRAHAALFNFYEQWFRADHLPLVKGGKYKDAYDDAMRASILASFDAQVDASLWQPQDAVRVLLTAPQAFVNAQTAPLFGVSGVTGTALQVVNVNASERIGILAHPAVMGSLATEEGTHPIKRGVFVWDQLLCQDLPNPPNGIPTFPGVPANSSTRQAYEAFTSGPTCQACHARINPVGFLFESYDTLGAFTQIDDSGQPVVPGGTIVQALTPTDEPDASVNVPTATAVELAQNIANSASVAECVVRQLYRYSMKRREASGDSAAIDALATGFAGTAQRIPELLVGMAKAEAFTNRWNEQ